MNLYQPHPYIITYDTEKYKFREAIQKMLGCKELEKIHELQHYGLLERKEDQSTQWHKLYYDNFAVFNEVYLKFMADFVKPFFELPKVVYQKIPTFRAHLVDNVGVGDWHRDNAYNHDNNEMNLLLPFTDAYDTNTIWTESEVGKEDFKPYNIKYGEILVFCGAQLMHGNKVNTTGNTRVSVDLRILPPEKFTPSAKPSVNGITKFDIGGYFEIM